MDGPAALTYNPANLALPTQVFNQQVLFGGFEAGSHQGFNLSGFPQNFNSFYDDWFVIDSNDYPVAVSSSQSDSEFNTTFFNYYDVPLVGYTQRTESLAWGLSLRTRSFNSSKINEDWYSLDSDAGGERTVQQQMMTLHEFNLGFATPMEMVTGWRGGLSSLTLGFNSKFVVAGMYFDGTYSSGYSPGDDGSWQHQQELNARSSGDLSRATDQLRAGSGDIQQAYNNIVERHSLSEPSGAGGGIDAGLTWVITFTDDTSLVPGSNETLSHNLRLSMSVTDIGAIHYNDEIFSYQNESTQQITDLPDESEYRFQGRAGEFHKFITSHSEEADVYQQLDKNEINDWVQLPTAFHFAGSYHNNWVMVGMDTSYHLNPLHYFDKGLYSRVSTELNLWNVVPLRAGMHFDPQFQTSYRLGFGLDFDQFEFGIDARIETNPDGEWKVREFSAGTFIYRL